MKKSTSYIDFIALRGGKILCAKCGYPTGIEGHCNHFCSMLFFLEEFCEINAKNTACTSQPMDDPNSLPILLLHPTLLLLSLLLPM